jgi:AcrR family transcriptional regulator
MATRTEEATERRAPLSRERVLHAAVDLADREGIEAVSMRRVGQELGVEAMSLYNHIANKEDLLDGMVDAVVGEIGPDADDGDWKPALRNRILAARRTMLRHPWASAVIGSRTQPSPAMMGYMDTTGGIFLRGGFSVDLMHHAFHALGSRVLGFSQELFDDSSELDQSPEMQAVMLQQMAAVYPNITKVVLQVNHDEASVVGSGCDDQFEFEFALDLMLDGLERLRDREAGP